MSLWFFFWNLWKENKNLFSRQILLFDKGRKDILIFLSFQCHCCLEMCFFFLSRYFLNTYLVLCRLGLWACGEEWRKGCRHEQCPPFLHGGRSQVINPQRRPQEPGMSIESGKEKSTLYLCFPSPAPLLNVSASVSDQSCQSCVHSLPSFPHSNPS